MAPDPWTTVLIVPPRKKDSLRALAGSLACAAIYVTARGIQLLRHGLEFGVSGSSVLELALMILTTFGLLMRWHHGAPLAVGLGLICAALGLVEFDLSAVGCLILLVGFRLEMSLFVAAVAGFAYLGLTTLLIDGNAPFLDAGLLFTTGIMMSFVRMRLSMAESREAAELAEQRADAETARSRLVSEIHDSVGHYLSAIQALSNGAQGDPNLSDEALGRISGLASSALSDSRRLIELASHSTSTEGRLTLSDLDRSLSEMKLFGVHKSINIVGTPSSPLTEDTVVRVVREAVTNAARHARDMAMLETSVCFYDSGAEVFVRNDGLMTTEPERRSGLAALSRLVVERGGTLASGPCPEGGWQVVARLV